MKIINQEILANMFEKLDLVNIIDSITTVMQCTLFILGINYCLEEDKKSL